MKKMCFILLIIFITTPAIKKFSFFDSQCIFVNIFDILQSYLALPPNYSLRGHSNSQNIFALAPQRFKNTFVEFELIDTGEDTYLKTYPIGTSAAYDSWQTNWDLNFSNALTQRFSEYFNYYKYLLDNMESLDEIVIVGGTKEELSSIVKIFQQFKINPRVIHIINPNARVLDQFLQSTPNYYQHLNDYSSNLLKVKFYQIEAKYISKYILNESIGLILGNMVLETGTIPDNDFDKTFVELRKVLVNNGILFHPGFGNPTELKGWDVIWDNWIIVKTEFFKTGKLLTQLITCSS